MVSTATIHYKLLILVTKYSG